MNLSQRPWKPLFPGHDPKEVRRKSNGGGEGAVTRLPLAILAACLLAGCIHPLASGTRAKLDPAPDYAAVSANPQHYVGRSLLLGGSIAGVNNSKEGSLLEILRWDVNRWGEPLALSEQGDRFLVQTREPLDDRLYSRGRLVTLGATLRGTATIVINDREEQVPLFDLLEMHLWETPFRYGLHPNPDPGMPEYVPPTDPGPDHPYDPTPWAYPYSPYWYRRQ